MSVTATAWNLTRDRRPSRCLISETDGGWDVIVWNGPSIVLWERQPTAEAASARADELWTVLVAYGAAPPDEHLKLVVGATDAFRRTCPDCEQPAARVTHVRGAYVVLACDACAYAWNDRRRTSTKDRRLTPRVGDRRKAA